MNFSFTRWNFGYHRAFSLIFLSYDGILAIMEPFKNFSFTQWNFGCHGAFIKLSQIFLMMEFGILGTFLKLSQIFLMMEFRLSRSLSQTFTNFFL
jgi:hypothetical protein